MPSDIPPKLGMLFSILDEQPPATRELFQYAFALLAVLWRSNMNHYDATQVEFF